MQLKLHMLLFAVLSAVSGCLEISNEITINEDGSGKIIQSVDLGQVLPAAEKNAGEDVKAKLPDLKTDTVYALAVFAEGLRDLSDVEKSMIKKGELRVTIDSKAKKFFVATALPFAAVEEIEMLQSVSEKIITEFVNNTGAELFHRHRDEIPVLKTIDEFFTTTYADGQIARTLNSKKYETVANDDFLFTNERSRSFRQDHEIEYSFQLTPAGV
ncbi:MAG: hypothetical protein IPH18_02715 [Chitinophagaceae bacterium]|nr:hypothetical protein [Chitinophagaceae bacterium]